MAEKFDLVAIGTGSGASAVAWYSSWRIAEEYSGCTVLIEEETERILGAHLLGPHAEDTINLFALAIRSGLTASGLEADDLRLPDARL